MSYIHDALKRAQKDKDNLYKRYEEIIGHGKGPARRSWFKKTAIGSFVILLFLATAGALWFQGLPSAQDAGRDIASMATPAVEEVGRSSAGGRAEAPGHLYMRALDYHSRGKLSEAENLYRKIPSDDPSHVFALNNLGVIFLVRGKRDEARALFLQSLGGDEDYADPWYNLACLYAGDGNSGRALEYLGKALAIKSEVEYWAREDADLEGLRSLPEFDELMLRNQ